MSRTLAEVIEANGITVRAEFVPFSQSRNKDEKDEKKNIRRSLNWKVALHKDSDSPLLVTDYGAGIAHCPSYNTKAPYNWNQNERNWQALVISYECEQGRKAKWMGATVGFGAARPLAPILPNTCDVVASLVMEAGTLDYNSFEDWASDFGYDADSRKAEKIYKDCLAIAIKLRNGLGESLLEELKEAAAGY